MDNNGRIVQLLAILTSEPTPSQRRFELPKDEFERHQQLRHEALGELARLQNNSAVRQMLSRVTREVSNGTIIVSELSGVLRDQVLQRVAEYAAILLPEFRRAQADESGVTNYQRFIREAANYDPFLEGSNLTRDAYSGRGEIEPDTWAQDRKR